MAGTLEHCTAILALRIDSTDRLRNAERCLTYLLTRFEGLRLIIREDGKKPQVEALLTKDEIRKHGSRVRYSFAEDHSPIFHRTKRLNECLRQVETPITIIHDIDVILPVESMIEAQRMILEEGFSVVTPFTNPPGCTDVPQKYADWMLSDSSSWEKLVKACRNHFAGNGFSLFVATKQYADRGGENEDFVSYGPEDDARLYSHTRLGMRYGRVQGRVFHMEHVRGANSSPLNPMFSRNVGVFNTMKLMTRDQLAEHFGGRRIELDHTVADIQTSL